MLSLLTERPLFRRGDGQAQADRLPHAAAYQTRRDISKWRRRPVEAE